MKSGHKISYKKNGTGIAFDIGTSSIAAAAVDLSSGRTLAAGGLPNPQTRWGADVLSRIQAIKSEPGALREQAGSLASAMNGLMKRLAPGGGGGVVEITAAGNPVMEEILLNISPEGLSRPPYRPAFKNSITIPARDLRLETDAPLYVFPLIGGFVGGDAVAVALALNLAGEHCALAIDIGTNSEILLGVGGTLYAASAAAGPAFEAAEIEAGMQAEEGAIQGARFGADGVKLDVLGPVAPRGICGSGLIEAVAGLVKAGVIDRSGRIRDRTEVETNLSTRIKEGKDGNSFVLYRGASEEISINQKDVRALQAAKSAIKAGITLLLRRAGVKASDVQKVYVAGAFGSSLKKDSLVSIGLLEPGCRIEAIGDAALDGAMLALVSDEKKREAESLARNAKYVSLSGSPRFQDEFIKGMDF